MTDSNNFPLIKPLMIPIPIMKSIFNSRLVPILNTIPISETIPNSITHSINYGKNIGNFEFWIKRILSIVILGLFLTQCGGDKEETYYCPMHPDYTSDSSGDCPICGMKLVVKKEKSGNQYDQDETDHVGDHKHNHSHSNQKEERHNHGIDKNKESHNHSKDKGMNHSRDPKEDNTKDKLPNSHTTQAKSFVVTPEQQKSIGVKTALVESREMESKIISSGQVVYDMELYTAMVEYVEAIRLGGTMDRSFLQASRRKLLRLGLSDEDIRVWARKNPEIFLTGRSGNRTYVFTQVFERDLRHLKIGKKVDMEANSYPGEKFQGTIIGWFKLLDEKNRSTQAWVEILDKKRKLQPRMFTETIIKVPHGKVLLVPRNAVMRTGVRDLVYVKIGADRFRPAKVTVGEETNNFIQILSGLEEGEEVVVGANFLLDSEARMQLGREL